MTKQELSRRDFILAGGAAAGAVLTGLIAGGGRGSLQATFAEGIGATSTPVVARKNGTVAQMVGECVAALGGMDRFVSGKKVAIKVNGSWSVSSADTTPEVVRQVIILAQMGGATSITVYDHTIEGATPGWTAIASAAQSQGAQAVMLTDSSTGYVSKSVPGVGLKSAMVAKVLDQADAVINVPKLKTHSGADVTIGLKNHMGTVQDRGAVHDGGGHGLDQGIADLNSCPTIAAKHHLTICDAIQPMVSGGPEVGTYADYNGILAGMDPVATDYIGTQIIRRYNSGVPQSPPHIVKAAALGLGTKDPTKIAFDERNVGMPVPEMPIALGLAGLAGLAMLYRRG